MSERSEELIRRIKKLELGQAKLKEELSSILKKDKQEDYDDNDGNHKRGRGVTNGGNIEGYYGRSPYYNVLKHMGHALYIYRPETGVIIYWNHAAETLYGWKEHEILGRVVPDLLIDESRHPNFEEIVERLENGQSWYGHISFRKRTGEMFMAMVTKSPLYENDNFVGVITMSNDSAVFIEKTKGKHKPGPENVRGLEESKASNGRIQWNQRPQITSSISDLASKVFSNNRMSSDSENENSNRGAEFVSRIMNLKANREVNRQFGVTTSQNCKEKIPFISKATKFQMNEAPYNNKSQN